MKAICPFGAGEAGDDARADLARSEAAGGILVLVVDDIEDNRLLLKAILERAGCRVLQAKSGAEAVAVYEAEDPDIILMDVMMPDMDGVDATRRIKSHARYGFVPIIFITALTDERQLANCLEAGGDDFIVKPINRTILKAKLFAMQRLRGIYRKYHRQQQELQALHERLRHEHEVAEHVFTRIIGKPAFDVANIQYKLSPLAIANGDLVLTMMTPSGDQLVLLGDFAGHGLSAAIGAIPVSDIFRTMAAKGFGITAIAAEINRKLHLNLPTGQFLAACLLEWTPRAGTVRIWNGGMPDVLIVGAHHGTVYKAASRNLPLGVVGGAGFEADTETRPVQDGDRIVLYSDGLIEARNAAGEMFGQPRLERLITDNRERSRLFQEVWDAVRGFRGDEPQNDDVALVEVLCDPRLLSDIGGPTTTMTNPSSHMANWKMNLHLGAADVAGFDPLAVAMCLVNCVPALKRHQSSLYMVVVELYMNALDHGLLAMEGALKHTPEGFAQYYAERERRLAGLGAGWIKLDITCFEQGEGGEVVVQVEDSGPGFDTTAIAPAEAAGTGAHGRGIGLVRSLCAELVYNARGNEARAVYNW